MNELQDLLELLDEVLDAVRDEDDMKALHKRYNRLVNKYQRSLWKRIKRAVAGVGKEDWLDDIGDAVTILQIIAARWG